MGRFTYDILNVTGVTKDEKAIWYEYAMAKGYHTLSKCLNDMLKEFKDIGLEEDVGVEIVPICSFDAVLNLKQPKRKSRAIRKYVNNRIKRGK